MRTDELDYSLPPELIAATPAAVRDEARLMVVRPDVAADTEVIQHRRVLDLPDILKPGDLLIVNDTKVLPAKFKAIRVATGGRVEGLFLETRDDQIWHMLLQSGGHLRPGESIQLGDVARLELLEQQPGGSWLARKHSELDTEAVLDRVGAMPLPPYITKARDTANAVDEQADQHDRHRYQTVYARQSGAVAAPTAGLHFTPHLLDSLRARGVLVASVTLHVGIGTFAPVRAATLEEHVMHRERFAVPAATLAALAAARRENRRIISIGTTSVRALESLPHDIPLVSSADYHGETEILIQPGFKLRFTDAMMTNFHLPRSTLLALVAALTGLPRLQRLYQTAIAEKYRFYSYGDAMIVLP